MFITHRRYRLGQIVSVFMLFVCAGVQPAGHARAQEPRAKGHDPIVNGKLHPALVRLVEESPEPVKAWVFFTDKGVYSEAERTNAIDGVAGTYNARAKQRRALRGDNARRGANLFDERDLPVVPEYINAVTATGARHHITSNWVNAISVYADGPCFDEIAKLPFVSKLQPVARSIRAAQPAVKVPATPWAFGGSGDGAPRSIDYGASLAQLEQINLVAVHDQGYNAAGVIVGILDTGFQRSHEAFNNPAHPLNVIAEWDFVDNDPDASFESGDPSSQHHHGTMILGVLGAYKPGALVGGAYGASFVLCKTENAAEEFPAEEDNYVAGLQFVEAHGADMVSASLGYIDWYTQDDLDGLTAVTTIAVNVATAHGLHSCNAAGNEWHDSDPGTSSLIAPADALQVITCGAVSSSGSIASFSSEGPTADGRVKPEVLARGESTHTVSPTGDSSYTSADGTSLSTPVVACAVACLIQAKPYWTVDEMRAALIETADYYVEHGTFDPLFVRGYGVIDAFAAYETCSHAGQVTLDRIQYACASSANVLVVDCGLNTDDAVVETVTVRIDSDSEVGVESVTLVETDPSSAAFVGAIALRVTDAAGVLKVTEGDAITVTYIDADNGAGGVDVVVTATAGVDCTPPVIENVHATDIAPRSAVVRFDSDEPVSGTVRYGLDCAVLTGTSQSGIFAPSTVVNLAGLVDDSTYYYAVDAEDRAGNISSDDNGGHCYSFSTPDVPEHFTEQFEEDNDLDNISLQFTPNGSVDHYAMCAQPISELPTDPTGGTALDLSNDDFATVTLSGGAQVTVYGTTYTTFYPSSNGYITFLSGDSDTGESLEDHFAQPRISGLFDDLNPDEGGTISWKQFSDRVVVTWDGVREFLSVTPNTFQVVMFFDGRIELNYLTVSAVDGLAGLSAGDGLDPDFFETDFSITGACGPRPPFVQDVEAQTALATPVGIALTALDDGLPDPPAALTYYVISLPAGTLRDAVDEHIITGGELPYALIAGGNTVVYTPPAGFGGPDGFTFLAHDGGVAPEGGASDIGTVSIVVGGPQVIHAFYLDEDPGWDVEGAWAFGAPTGGGSHDGDPLSGHTGGNVYGFNLDGDYTDLMDQYVLTTTALDCTDLTDVELRFWRWLGVESGEYDHAHVAVSNDGVTWTIVWEHTGDSISDTEWHQMVFDVSDVADGAATVYVRWAMGETDVSVTYPGWNIDDIEIWGVRSMSGCESTAACPFADVNCDDIVDGFDIAVIRGTGNWLKQTAECAEPRADVDGSGLIDGFDVAAVRSSACWLR